MQKVWNSENLEQALEANDWMRLQEQVRSHIADLLPIATATKSRLVPFENVRGVFFDIYGTLLISSCGEILSGQLENLQKDGAAALDRQALQCLPELLYTSLPSDFSPSSLLEKSIITQHREMKSKALQYPEVDIVTLWHQIFLDQLSEDMHSSLSPFILARFALEYELLHNRIRLMPGTLELLHWLAVRDFYIGIISNAQFYTPIILSALLGVHGLPDLNIQEDLCFWSYRYACSKPQPELFAAAHNKLAHYDLEPKEILYVGNDMRNDIWGAKNAGFLTALFAGDQRSLRLRKEISEVVATKPDAVITDLGQLKGVL